MTNFLLRYLGLMVMSFLVYPLTTSVSQYYIVVGVSAIAITISNIYYYRLGERGDEL